MQGNNVAAMTKVTPSEDLANESEDNAGRIRHTSIAP
jgi:hypothetical protein